MKLLTGSWYIHLKDSEIKLRSINMVALSPCRLLVRGVWYQLAKPLTIYGGMANLGFGTVRAHEILGHACMHIPAPAGPIHLKGPISCDSVRMVDSRELGTCVAPF